MAVDVTRELSGLDALELGTRESIRSRGSQFWAATWPKLLAIGLAVAVWQVVVWLEWKPDYVLPGPGPVFAELGEMLATSEFWRGLTITMRRALTGFALATVIGMLLGIAVARFKLLRAGVGSLITALQTMPSIAWFPLAILLFQLTEEAILFVIVLGAAPSIANGVLAGVDYVPPLLLRAGRNIGARGVAMYRFVIAPASLPAIVAGLKQGWAFAWRSLMAGELLVIIAESPALGTRLQFARELNDPYGLLATMIVILTIGIFVDAAFGAADRAIRTRWGVAERR